MKTLNINMPTAKSTTTPRPKLMRFDWAMKSLLRNKANFDILKPY